MDHTAPLQATNIVWHHSHVSRLAREKLLAQHGITIWLTGLSGSGKSTIAFTLEHWLIEQGYLAYVLDGDNIRHGLNKNIGFSPEDRVENIRRIGEVAKLFADSGTILITSFISPYQSDRQMVRDLHDAANLPFMEIFVNTPLSVCEARDPKGLYKRARAGEIKMFTGIDAPYEAPVNPDMILASDILSPVECSLAIYQRLQEQNIVNPKRRCD